jgi:hypothetical protein
LFYTLLLYRRSSTMLMPASPLPLSEEP